MQTYMQTYIKIGGELIAAAINGMISDKSWDGRASKTIRLAMTHDDAASTFVDNIPWSIVVEYDDETPTEEYDNSEYCVAGTITDHRDGTVSVKMGEKTEIEVLIEQMVTPENFTGAYIEGVNAL